MVICALIFVVSLFVFFRCRVGCRVVVVSWIVRWSLCWFCSFGQHMHNGIPRTYPIFTVVKIPVSFQYSRKRKSVPFPILNNRGKNKKNTIKIPENVNRRPATVGSLRFHQPRTFDILATVLPRRHSIVFFLFFDPISYLLHLQKCTT
jgi:hypothetical protein